MLIVSELAEALEAARKHDPVSEKIPPHGMVVEELADAIIRILDACHLYQMDVAGAIEAKMAYNRTRSKRHGGKAY